MKVGTGPTYALDATPLISRPTGIGRYVRELVDGMAPALEEGERLLLHAGTARLNPLFGVSHDTLRHAARHPRVAVHRTWVPLSLTHALWNRVSFPPVKTMTGPVAVYHGTNFLLPVVRDARRIVTIHDLAILRLPGSVPANVARRFRTTVTRAVERADRIVTDSECTRRDVLELLSVDEDRVTTIPLGVGREFSPGGDRERDGEALAELGVSTPYVLFVGTTNPRKNVERLLDAFALARERASLPHRLVLVGDPGFGAAGVSERVAALGIEDAVARPGYVSEAALPALYRGADALAFPSLYEGFGLPLLEAMASGCPVLAGDASSLPEVAGDAALLVDPGDTEAIAAGLERLLTDAGLRTALAGAGLERAADFTWARCAQAHLALYRALAAL